MYVSYYVWYASIIVVFFHTYDLQFDAAGAVQHFFAMNWIQLADILNLGENLRIFIAFLPIRQCVIISNWLFILFSNWITRKKKKTASTMPSGVVLIVYCLNLNSILYTCVNCQKSTLFQCIGVCFFVLFVCVSERMNAYIWYKSVYVYAMVDTACVQMNVLLLWAAESYSWFFRWFVSLRYAYTVLIQLICLNVVSTQ